MRSHKAKEFIDGCMDHLTVELSGHAKWQLRAAMTHAAELAERELLSEFTPAIRKAHFTFNDFIAVFPVLKNEPIFSEIKELFKKYEDETD